MVRPTRRTFLAAVRAGRTFATNAPLLDFSLAGQGIGGEVARPAGRQRLEAKVHLRSLVPVDHLADRGQRPGGGRGPAHRAPHQRRRHRCLSPSSAPAGTPCAPGPRRSRHPVLDGYPFATTSPIYVTLGGAPVRSPADARYFEAWIDRVAEAVASIPTGTPPRRRKACSRIWPRPERCLRNAARPWKVSRTHDLPRPPLRGRRALLRRLLRAPGPGGVFRRPRRGEAGRGAVCATPTGPAPPCSSAATAARRRWPTTWPATT